METSSSHHDNSNATQETEVQKLIKNFGSYTTLHGLHFLFESSSTVRRILWIILMVACMLILAFQLKYCYLKLQSHESLVTKDIEYSKSFLFPAVTICNQNMLLKSKILGTDAQEYLDDIDNLKYVSRHINSSFNILEVAKEAGHNLTVMMKRCSWRGQRCGPENFTSFATLLVSASVHMGFIILHILMHVLFCLPAYVLFFRVSLTLSIADIKEAEVLNTIHNYAWSG